MRKICETQKTEKIAQVVKKMMQVITIHSDMRAPYLRM